MKEIKGAELSGNKRYRLWRVWESKKPFLFYILLNPSTGDHQKDDPTLKRLRYFSAKFGYGGFYVGNLYPWITPNPKQLYQKDLSIDPHNIYHLKQMHQCCNSTVYAWGNNEIEPHYLKNFIIDPLCFGFNKNGTPKHPLYLPNSSELVQYDSENLFEKKSQRSQACKNQN